MGKMKILEEYFSYFFLFYRNICEYIYNIKA